MPTRRQATLYLRGPRQSNIEMIRAKYNPAQARIIAAHVTLCREDEVLDWEQFQTQLSRVPADRIAVELTFERLIRQNNLVFAQATANCQTFDCLRNEVLANENNRPRIHQPHLTLIHPRNGICDDRLFAELQTTFEPFSATFDRVTIIEQNGGGKWINLFEHPAEEFGQ